MRPRSRLPVLPLPGLLRVLPCLLPCLLACLPLGPAALRAQSGADAGAAAAPAPAPLAVAIVGASVSAGFVDGPLSGGSPDNRTVPLLAVLRGWLRQTGGRVQSRADLVMFLDAESSGSRQVGQTRRNPPDLVVAIDFLFWFGYGHVRGAAGDERALRLARLEQGLSLLDSLEVPLLVGDLPDMQGAARRMIHPRQIPSPEVLAALNERIGAWAAGRPRVRLFRLGDQVRAMKGQGVELPLAQGPFATPPGSLLQGDRLHANRLGMAWLGFQLQREVAAALPAESAAGLPQWAVERFVELCGAEGELADLRARAAADR